MQNVKSPKESMDDLYNKRDDLGDITFRVESEQIKAHRCVLASICPKYRAQFFGLHATSDEIPIPNVSAAAFNVFLQFFYKEKIDLTIENVEEVLDLAKQSLVDEFVDTCIRFLEMHIKSENVCWAYSLADKYDLGSLRSRCEGEIQSNERDVLIRWFSLLQLRHAVDNFENGWVGMQ